MVLHWYVLHIECGQCDNCLTKNVGNRSNMSKSYDPKETRDFALEGSYFREAWIEAQSDGGVLTVPTLDKMITLTASPSARRRLSMSFNIAATDHTRRQFANAYRQVRQLGEHSLAHLVW